VGSYDHKVYAIKEGNKVWEFATGDLVHSDPFEVRRHHLYRGHDASSIHKGWKRGLAHDAGAVLHTP